MQKAAIFSEQLLTSLLSHYAADEHPEYHALMLVGSSLKCWNGPHSDLDFRLLTRRNAPIEPNAARNVYRSNHSNQDVFCRPIFQSELLLLSDDELSMFVWHSSPITLVAGNTSYWHDQLLALHDCFSSSLDSLLLKKYVSFRSARNQYKSESMAKNTASKAISHHLTIRSGFEFLCLTTGRPFPYVKWLEREVRSLFHAREDIMSILNSLEQRSPLKNDSIELLHEIVEQEASNILDNRVRLNWWSYLTAHSF